MTLSVSTIGDNTSAPFIRAETYVPDQLIAGNLKLVTQPILLNSGTLKRGTVLGKVSSQAIESAHGANTGNGTIGSISAGAAILLGAYVLTATSATVFSVVDPEGNALPNATVGTAYANAAINFTITAGGTAFVAGDSFSLTASDAVGQYISSVRTASDGSQNPVAVLVDDADASGGPVTTGAYVMGEFNANALIYDSSWTLPQLMGAISATIFIKAAVSAADPS